MQPQKLNKCSLPQNGGNRGLPQTGHHPACMHTPLPFSLTVHGCYSVHDSPYLVVGGSLSMVGWEEPDQMPPVMDNYNTCIGEGLLLLHLPQQTTRISFYASVHPSCCDYIASSPSSARCVYMTFGPTEKNHTQYVVRAEEGEPGNEASCDWEPLYRSKVSL